MKLLPVAISDGSVAVVEQPAEAETLPVNTSVVHIKLGGGVALSLEGSVDPALVRAVIECLRR